MKQIHKWVVVDKSKGHALVSTHKSCDIAYAKANESPAYLVWLGRLFVKAQPEGVYEFVEPEEVA